MRKNIYIIILTLFAFSCEVDNIGPLLDENVDIIFFLSDGIEVNENSTEEIVIEVGSIKGGNSTTFALGGTAVKGVDYTISDDLNISFQEGIYIAEITISLIDNTTRNDDKSIVLSLPEGQGYSESDRREFVIDIINDDINTFITQISRGSDDAEEGINGSSPGRMDVSSSDLEIGETEGSTRGVEKIGLRFTEITIPKGAIIRSANIQFTVDEDVDTPANVIMVIKGENVDNSVTFTEEDFNISDRSLTAVGIEWNIPEWSVVDESGPTQRTEDISEVIQEIIDREGWTSGNSMSIIMEPNEATLANGRETGRVARSYDEDAAKAAVITIKWE